MEHEKKSLKVFSTDSDVDIKFKIRKGKLRIGARR